MFAEVSVNSPVARQRTFSYEIPANLSVASGQAVWVPFGPNILQGIVVRLTDYPAVEDVKEIFDNIEARPLVSSERIALALWLSEYYSSPLFDCISLMLPPGFERRTFTFLKATNKEFDDASLAPEHLKILEIVRQTTVGLIELERIFGKIKTQSIVRTLVNRGLIERSYEMEKIRVSPKTVPYLELQVEPARAATEAAALKTRAAKQAALLEYLAAADHPVSVTRATKILNFSPVAIKALAAKGLLKVTPLEVKREPISQMQSQPPLPVVLTAAQQTALERIKASLTEKRQDIYLLHGVTGSGKTEIYLRALAETVRLGKKGLVLVPEISLTSQTIERFTARFPRRVAVMHSHLGLGEQFDEWQSIRNGECDVVIGPRSALFVPQPDLGLIVIDEEHEWTYKQTEQSPRYHARTAAIKLAELTGAPVILGSATPDVESYYRAERGVYRLLELLDRVTPAEHSPLPEVEIVDMKKELKSGNLSIFSRSLAKSLDIEIKNHHQAILFLNRRGGASFVQCRRCSYTMRCKRCDLSLTYHIDSEQLVCHQCNYRTAVPVTCPRCSSRSIKYVGIGTQKVEEETRLAFPSARPLRLDSDVSGEKHAHEDLLTEFRTERANILIGTQMIAKGLDFPNITLVGVINADISLNLPDFRAGERTYQLLSQVAGRAGRGAAGGRVVIQTYSPDHYAVQAAARHDYPLFYKQEIAYRRQLNNPPFTGLVRLVYQHGNEARCRKEAENLSKAIAREIDEKGIAGLDIIGPAPAYFSRIRGRYRWQIVLRGIAPAAVLAGITLAKGWTVDVDPVGI